MEGNYFDLSDNLKTHPDFDLLLTGDHMTGNPSLSPFLCIKKYHRSLADKYQLPNFNHWSLKELPTPTNEEIQLFFQYRFDSGLKGLSDGACSWHMLGSIS